ncbi:hypothetical protein E2C01_078005 [Portunus trituberculatus]|uniref:Uncharacterized protein n=1 Tax=Portunus trituberculatus TaxID=210409 RepID=A0A5B7IRK8_PORTR|nr:hypothetical protein [Portunus trituberculatus]
MAASGIRNKGGSLGELNRLSPQKPRLRRLDLVKGARVTTHTSITFTIPSIHLPMCTYSTTSTHLQQSSDMVDGLMDVGVRVVYNFLDDVTSIMEPQPPPQPTSSSLQDYNLILLDINAQASFSIITTWHLTMMAGGVGQGGGGAQADEAPCNCFIFTLTSL